MIPFEDARDIVRSAAWILPSESVALGGAAGRVLRAPARVDMDIPPFRRANVDGYACREADLDEPMEVIELIPAGRMPEKRIGPGQCAKIMTGAPVPEGADCVIMVEHTKAAGESAIRFTGTPGKSNISPRGEDLKGGDMLVPAPLRLEPQHLALLATAGAAKVSVSRRPRVQILSTGDELVPPEEQPPPGFIRNSNNVNLCAQARAAGADAADAGIVRDDPEAMRRAFILALDQADVVISTGGVSMGDFDHVPRILEEMGLDLRVRKVAIQPGKPMVFAAGEEKAFFGLSGNPVSSFLQFELFVKPFLLRLQGVEYRPLEVRAPFAETRSRRDARRMLWVPVRIEEGRAHPLPYHGSAHMHALLQMDGFAAYPVGVDTLEAGQDVPVRLVRCG